jgi:hypothetical protein
VRFDGAYTRLEVRGVIPDVQDAASGAADPPTRPMQYESRRWMERYLIGKKMDIALLARVKVDSYEENVALASVSSSSDREGESWERNVTHSAFSFPWFLVRSGGPGTAPRLTLTLKASEKYDSGVATGALQVALTAVRAVAPEADVVTTLSASSARTKAQAIDKAFSELFSRSISESHSTDRSLALWSRDGGLILSAEVPARQGDWNGSKLKLGEWRVTFAAPRASVFSDWHLCDPDHGGERCKPTLAEAAAEVYREKNAASVLAYQLVRTSAGDLTVRDFLLQQNWYTTASSSVTGDAANDAWAAGRLCSGTAHAMHTLGLNTVDANLVAWAMARGMEHPRPLHKDAWTAPACSAILGPIEK